MPLSLETVSTPSGDVGNRYRAYTANQIRHYRTRVYHAPCETGEDMIRLLLVEQEPLIGRGLCMWLRQVSSEVSVVGETETAAEALVLAHKLAPDVVLLDLAVPAVEAAAATTALRAAAPESAVVLLSLHDDEIGRRDALAAGAYAFVGKQEGVAVLLQAIHEAGRSASRSTRPVDG